jgi:hypothetical protein
LSLADLSFLVLAIGLGAGIARGSHEAWGMRPAGSMGMQPVPLVRTAGVAIEIASVWLAMILARGMLGLWRRRGTEPEVAGRGGLLASLAWRGLAIVLLLGLAMREFEILRIKFEMLQARSDVQVDWRSWYGVRETLVPVVAVLAVIGLALGAGAGDTFARSGPRRWRPYWLFVPLAALAGLLFLGQSNGWWTIVAQLVVIALEAVNNAMRPAYQATSDALSARMLRAGIEAIPAAVACLWLALVVARDFDRERRGRPWATTRGGWILRIASLAMALAAGVFAALVAIPTIQPHLFHGFGRILEREVVGMVLLGFGGLSAGLAARALTPPTDAIRPRWMTRLGTVVFLVLMSVILVSALESLPSSTQLDPAVPAIIGRICDLAREVPAWIWSLVPDSGGFSLAALLEPERLTWILAISAVAFLLLELAVSRNPMERPAPFDAIAVSRDRLARFLWLTVALTAVCLVALPTLIVLSQVMVHIRFMIDNWMTFGWPSPF